MTPMDKAKQNIIEFLPNGHLYKNYINNDLAGDFAYDLSEALQALRELQSVDVEVLKKAEPTLYKNDSDYVKGHRRGQQVGWNDCIEHLAARGLIGSGWMPIETAPKDGTWIILTDVRVMDVSVVACWDESENEPYNWGALDQSYHSDTFTHWMPLPAPPKNGGE